jgi:hypothetical protein
MEVKNVYQDASGQWHIEYSAMNLMGLAIRVSVGQTLLSIVLVATSWALTSIVSGKTIDERPNITPSSNSNVPQKSVCQ